MEALLNRVSNRETATLVWLVIGLGCVSTYVNIFTLMMPLLKVSLRRPILSILGVMMAYVASVVWLHSQCGLRSAAHSKETVIWAIAVGFVALIDAVRNDDPYRVVGRFLRDAIAVTVLVEFLVGLSSFNFLVELLLVPTVALLGIAYAVYEADDTYKDAAKVISWMLALIRW